MASLKIATQPPANLDNFVQVPAASSMAPPVSAAQIKTSGLNDLAYAPTPAPLTTPYEQLSQWQRPGVSQFRIPPLSARSNSAIVSTVRQISNQTIVETVTGSFLPLAGGTLTGPLVIAQTTAPFAIQSLTASPVSLVGPLLCQGELELINSVAATSSSQSQAPQPLEFSGNFWDGTALASKNGAFTLTQTFSPGVTSGSQLTLSFATNSAHCTGELIIDGSISPIQFSGSFLPTIIQATFKGDAASTQYPLSAAGNASAGLTTYTGVIAVAGEYLAGQNVTIAGFSNAGNNGTFVVHSCTTSQVVVWNAGGVAESHAATVTSQGQYFNDAGFIFTENYVSSYTILGTNYAPATVTLSSPPNQVLLALGVKGDSNDSTYFRQISDGANGSGSHGLEIGSIIDGTGTAPIAIQMGVFNSLTGITFAQLQAATSGSNRSSFPLIIQSQYWTGSATALNSWSLQDVLGSGSNPTSTLTLQQSGTSGAALLSIVAPVQAKTLVLTTAAPTAAAGQLGMGATTATSATAGTNGAVPAQVVGYLIWNLAGTTIKIPYFNN